MCSSATICPRFDHCEPRCGVRMTLGHLDEVFRFCTADFESCPVFRASGAGGGVVDTATRAIAEESGDAGPSHGRFRLCDGPIADDVGRLADACVGRIAEITVGIAAGINAGINAGTTVELTVERAPLGRPAVA